jgi:tetratricopeptide (TPR) repeat protein
MKKDQPSQSLPELEILEESTVLDWLHKNSQNLIYALGALVALFILGTWFFSHKTTKAEGDYLTAENLIVKIEAPILSEEDRANHAQAFEQLAQIVSRHPELQAKYDGLMAQALISQGKIQEAQPIAERNLKRVESDNLPLYRSYADGTLFIAQQQYDQALKLALQEQAQMQAQAKAAKDENAPRTFGDALYAFNTMRIAMLQQQAGHYAEAAQAWDSLLQSVSGQDAVISDRRAAEAVIAHIDESGVSLPSYIEAQKMKK